MIHLTSITNTFFATLLDRLGCKPPPPEGFDLINTVQPVSLVDSDIALPVITTSQLLDTASTIGLQANPAINTVLADTMALPAGNYLITVLISMADDTVAGAVALQRRNAANADNIWQHVFQSGIGTNIGTPNNLQLSLRVRLAVNERIRVMVYQATGATAKYQATIWSQPV
jgi:hypothetical protein